MNRKHLTTPLRNIWKYNKLHNFINVLGLSIGIAISLMILLITAHELSFDRFHENASQIYLSSAEIKLDKSEIQAHKMSVHFGQVVSENSPHIEDYVRVKEGKKAVISSDQSHRFFEQNFIFADNSFFSVFSFVLLSGDRKNALLKPNTVVISKRIATKYFGTNDPLGETITYGENITFEVTGVIENPPSNSTLSFDFISSFSSLPTIERFELSDPSGEIPYEAGHVGLGAYSTYFLIREGSDIEKVEEIIPSLVRQSGIVDENVRYYLEPLLKIHSEYRQLTRYIPTLLGIGLVILLLAIINYISLTTAKSTQRATEVGVRKAFGASRLEIALQFYTESLIVIVLSFIISMILCISFGNLIIEILHLDVDFKLLYSPTAILISCSVLAFCGLIAGSYPALLLSYFSPVEVLKGKSSSRGQGALVRRILILFQFTASVILIFSTLIIVKQLAFLRNQDIGFNKDQILVVPLDRASTKSYVALKNQILQLSSVINVAGSSLPLFRERTNVFFTKAAEAIEEVSVCTMVIDKDFIQTLGIKWETEPKDSNILSSNGKVVVNHEAVKKLGYTEDPIGQKIMLGTENEIVGIVEDFNFTSSHQKIDALILSIENDTSSSIVSHGGCVFIKLSAKANFQENVYSIKQLYEQFYDESPFEYYFLDDAFDSLYAIDLRVARVFSILTCIAILIASIGLLGLSTFVVEAKNKEIGIRKVLGASTLNVVTLLFGTYFRLILFSFVIAFPVSWLVMNRWLQDYAYRVQIQWWHFAISGIVAFLIVFLTVAYQTFKAASINPSISIKENS